MKQDEAFGYVSAAHARGRLAQAYVVAADPKGQGRTFAVRLLQLLFCQAPDQRPCGECQPCRQTAQGTLADILWLEPQSASRQIVIEQIRVLQRRMQQTAFSGGWKACVISAADRLNRDASNAFLKTLEEPSGKSLFLLLTEHPQQLLPTIASRCQDIVLSAQPVEAPDVWSQQFLDLLGETAGQAAISPLLAALTRARLLVALLKEVREAAEKEVEQEAGDAAADIEDDVLAARISARVREVRSALMRILLQWQRDQLILVCDGDAATLHYPRALEALRAQSRGLTRAEAVRRVRLVETMHEQLDRNLPEALVFETGFPQLAGV